MKFKTCNDASGIRKMKKLKLFNVENNHEVYIL